MAPEKINPGGGFAMLCAFALMIFAGCASAPRYPVSDHFNGRTFYNPTPVKTVGFWSLMAHVLWGRGDAWPDSLPNQPALKLSIAPGPDGAAITFVNHATVLIQMDGLNILTDPIWSRTAGLWGWAGPTRARKPGIPFDKLPPIDLVLISHNHYDHLDLPTLRKLNKRDAPLVLVPLGDKTLLESAGIRRVREMDWWQSAKVKPGVDVVFTPAQHNSGRGLFDQKKSLWGSFMIRAGGKKIYFAGDTAYSKHFKTIRAKLGAPDLAILPIGAYAPRNRMGSHHMDPAQAVRAQLDLGAPRAMGVHFGTFQLTAEPWYQPPIDLKAALRARNLDQASFLVPREGRTMVLDLKKRRRDVAGRP